MGKEDISKKAYLSDKRRFADLFNGTLMNGEQVIKPEELKSCPTVMDISDEKGIVERLTDISMTYKYDGSRLVMIMLENQDYTDFGMPVRVMLEQAMLYDFQLKELRKKNEGLSLKNDEYLSGIKKTDRLKPVIVLVVYWGDGNWNGPQSIHDMFDFGSMPEGLRKLVPQYGINVINMKNYSGSENFRTELKAFTGMYYCRNSSKKMKEYIKNHKECYKIDRDTFWAIANVSSRSCTKVLNQYIEKEEIDMCKAFEEIWNEGLERGRNEGLEQGRSEGIVRGRVEQSVDIIRKLKLKGMNLVEISELLAQPKEYISNIFKLLEDNTSLDNIDISSIIPEECY